MALVHLLKRFRFQRSADTEVKSIYRVYLFMSCLKGLYLLAFSQNFAKII